MTKLIENLNKSWTDDSEGISLTPTVDTKNIFFYAQAIGKYRVYPSYFTERTSLQSYLLLLTNEGKGTLTYQNKDYALKPGSLLFIDCETPHRYESASEELWSFSWVHFHGSTANGYYRLFTKQNASPVVSVEENPSFDKNLTQLLELNRHLTGRNALLTSRIITDILTELLLLNAPTDQNYSNVPEYMWNILSNINHSYTEDISLEKYAKLYNLDMYYLSREFKRYFQINFKQYVINKRLNYAKDLLKFSDKTVTEIAEDCGFSNFSHFLLQFRTHEGVTPLKFRKLWRQI